MNTEKKQLNATQLLGFKASAKVGLKPSSTRNVETKVGAKVGGKVPPAPVE